MLRPGGVVIHWLDMSTRLNEIFSQLARSTLMPIPNVFGDPSAARWPEDLFLVQRRELELVLGILARHRHPLSSPLRQYLSLFSGQPFPLRTAIAEFVQLVQSAELRRSLRSLFKDAAELAEAELRPQIADFFGRPVSSARHFESRLRHWFFPQAGFRVELSDVSRAWELEFREPRAIRFRTRAPAWASSESYRRIPEARIVLGCETSNRNAIASRARDFRVRRQTRLSRSKPPERPGWLQLASRNRMRAETDQDRPSEIRSRPRQNDGYTHAPREDFPIARDVRVCPRRSRLHGQAARARRQRFQRWSRRPWCRPRRSRRSRRPRRARRRPAGHRSGKQGHAPAEPGRIQRHGAGRARHHAGSGHRALAWR